ncbi:hypothetical protein ABEW05_011675 [Botrytis cinerea]
MRQAVTLINNSRTPKASTYGEMARRNGELQDVDSGISLKWLRDHLSLLIVNLMYFQSTSSLPSTLASSGKSVNRMFKSPERVEPYCIRTQSPILMLLWKNDVGDIGDNDGIDDIGDMFEIWERHNFLHHEITKKRVAK